VDNPIKTKTVTSFEDTAIAFSAKSNAALRKMYWLFWAMNNNFIVRFGTAAISMAFSMRLPIKWVVKNTIFSHFCGGESIEDCQKTIDNLAKYGIGTILDYSVEGEKNESSFDKTAQEIIETVEMAARNRTKIPFSVFKVTGIGSFDLLAKVQAGEALSSQEAQNWQKVQNRVETICQKAHELQVRIFVDAEESWIQDAIDGLAYQMMQKYNKESPIVYNTFQMYCHATLANLKKALADAEAQDYWLGAKVVRGAYMEKERARAEEKGYPDPIQPDKASSDRDFDLAIAFCVENHHRTAICAGTHNEQSSYLLTQLLDKHQIMPENPNFYFAQLFGMSDHISYNLAKAGYNVAKYVPYGPVKAVIPYLFRRATENTSVAGQSSREFNLIRQEVKRRRKAR
jgi:proline dehydrogenase